MVHEIIIGTITLAAVGGTFTCLLAFAGYIPYKEREENFVDDIFADEQPVEEKPEKETPFVPMSEADQHHVWCNHFNRPRKDCKMCEGFFKAFPYSNETELAELMQKHFPGNVVRK